MIEDVRNRHRMRTKSRYVVKGEDVLLAVDKREEVKEIDTPYGKQKLVVKLGEGKEPNANEEATILQLGKQAFSYLDEDERYKVGDKVSITRYSGKILGINSEGLDLVCIVDTGIHALILNEERE